MMMGDDASKQLPARRTAKGNGYIGELEGAKVGEGGRLGVWRIRIEAK